MRRAHLPSLLALAALAACTGAPAPVAAPPPGPAARGPCRCARRTCASSCTRWRRTAWRGAPRHGGRDAGRGLPGAPAGGAGRAARGRHRLLPDRPRGRGRSGRLRLAGSVDELAELPAEQRRAGLQRRRDDPRQRPRPAPRGRHRGRALRPRGHRGARWTATASTTARTTTPPAPWPCWRSPARWRAARRRSAPSSSSSPRARRWGCWARAGTCSTPWCPWTARRRASSWR